MKPCGMADCQDWCADSEAWCDAHKRAIAPPRKRTAYDALPEQVRGIGVVTTRRILVHRPKSVRRSMPVNQFSDWSYSMQRDLTELERRKRTIPRDTTGKTVAEARASRRAQTIKLLGIVGTLGEGDRD